MTYKLLWHTDALEDLHEIAKADAEKVINKVEQYLIKAPFELGKPLKGKFKGFFRYRFGKYRIVYYVERNNLIVFILKVGKRDKVYN